MPPRQQQQSQYLDADHQRISEFAVDYFDDEEERATFLDTLMERRGYQRTNGWSPPAPAPQPPAGGGGGQPPAGSKTPYFKQR